MQEHIKKPLAEELLFGRLTGGGVVKITVKKDELVFDYGPASASEKTIPVEVNETKNNVRNKKVRAR